MADDVVIGRIEDWRRRLIDLSYRNRLIKYRALKSSSLSIQAPATESLLADMGRTKPWDFYFPPEPEEQDDDSTTEVEALVDEVVSAKAQVDRQPLPDEIVVSETHPKRIHRTLENLARKSNAEFQDKGLRILYLAVGFLDWVDPGKDEALSSPLVLVPVRLHRPAASQPYQLFFVDDEEVVVNPSLIEKLRLDASLEIPQDFAWEDKPILTELDEIRAAVAPKGWTVRPDAVLGLFSFQKYVMYRDLLDNEATIGAHPIVQALARKEAFVGSGSQLDIPQLADLDDAQPSGKSFSVLDADATQRRCIEAAKRGQSFVMHGPPGTGKSQTIANVIAEAIGQGKKVLFVSEKAAALDVVHGRLVDRGLGDYCLMLHGEHASRREVVDALHSSLTTELVPRLVFPREEGLRLDSLRDYLNGQAETLHAAEPLLGDRSIREVYAELATVHSALSMPGAPPASSIDGHAVILEFQQLTDSFSRIAERWRVSPANYVWRDFDAERMTSDDQARVIQVLERVRASSIATSQSADIVAGRIGWTGTAALTDLDRLLTLGEHLRLAPDVAPHWLDVEMPAQLRETSEAARGAYAAEAEASRGVQDTFVGRDIGTLRDDLDGMLAACTRALEDAGGVTDRWERELLRSVDALLSMVSDVPSMTEAVRRRVVEVAALLGQPDTDASPIRCGELIELARLAFDPPARPERAWLVQAGVARARTALGEATPLVTDYQRERDRLLDQWTPTALTSDARVLADRCAEVARLRAEPQASWTTRGLELDARSLLDRWTASEAKRESLLEGWTTAALTEGVVGVAKRFRDTHVGALAKVKGSYRSDVKFVRQLRLDERMPDDPAESLQLLAEWQTERQSIEDVVRANRTSPELPSAVSDALERLDAYQTADRELDAVVVPLLERATSRPDDAEATFHAIAALADLGSRIDHEAPRFGEALGEWWDGRETDVVTVASAVETAERAIGLRHADSDLHALASRLCRGAVADINLAQGADQLESVLATLEQTFIRLAEFLTHARLDRAATSLSEADAVARRLLAPLSNFVAVARDIDTGAVAPAQTLDELATRARDLAMLRTRRAEIRATESAWARVIGPLFSGGETQWSAVDLGADWVDGLFRHISAVSPEISAQLLSESPRWPDLDGLRHAVESYRHAADDLVELFADPRRTALEADVRDAPLENLRDLTGQMLTAVDTLHDWTDLRLFRGRATAAGWGEFVDQLVAADVTHDDVLPAFQRAYWNRRLEALFEDEPELEEDFRGGSYQRFIADFQRLDKQLVRTGPDRLIALRNVENTQHIAVPGSEVAILRGEAGKLRRHKPVRRLLSEIPKLLSDLKPCLMMSPLSVSHYLTAAHHFDLVLFDEASQVPPQDAVNCVYRGDQLIVAGDAKQLPPTAFFQLSDTGDTSDDEELQEDMESVLDSCQALLPEYYLRWHYRSRHEDLIAFSNENIYDGELVTFPTPDHLAADKGIDFHLVPDGVYARGKTQTNVVEAAAVAKRLVDCLRDGSGRSVGVIAFNLAQATAISNELDLLRVRNPDLEAYFSGDRLDGPFVKHLESVQGDERDLIIFSVGYGRDEAGRFPMSFGPLNKAGGHRRLNVAITRARAKIEIFASVGSKDFVLSDAASQGARLLRDYIAFAERSGSNAELDRLGDSDHYAVTGLEREIGRELERLGLHVVHQVGAGTMRVDLGVIDPQLPNQFLMAIECDGPAYRNTPTARDRDRLRQEVLTALGWRIHRVWSLDWVRNRAAEVERLVEAIEAARQGPPPTDVPHGDADLDDRGVSPQRVERPVVDLRDPSSFQFLPWVEPYERAAIAHQYARDAFHEPENRAQQATVATEILLTEAPVHMDYLVHRLAESYGLQRVGNRVEAAARQAIDRAVREGGFERRGEFIWRSDQTLDVVRRPQDGDPRTRREIERIPPDEIDLVISRLREFSRDASSDDVIVAAARILGFDRAGPLIKSSLERRLKAVKRRESQ